MLQQTQVATVIGHYARFLESFPTVGDLARATEDQVLLLWEGLGYYRRARQMHRAARLIMREHGGQFPRDPHAVSSLPGIGRYTAGAVTSIAFDAREPILEANTSRLFARLLAWRGDPGHSIARESFWKLAAELLPRHGAGTFNQALMEVGSQICRPRAPRCDVCPLASLCPTCLGGWQDKIPRRARRPIVENIREAVVVVWRAKRVLLVRKKDGERWAGLWDFPRFRMQATDPAALENDAVHELRAMTGILVRPRRLVAVWKHGVTKYRITLSCHEADYVRGPRHLNDEMLAWVSLGELERYPLPRTGRRLCRLLQTEAQDASPRA